MILWMLACTLEPTKTVSMQLEPKNDGVGLEARQALARGEREDALRAFDDAVANGADFGVQMQRAHALRIAGRPGEARAAYEALYAKHPDEAVLALALGELARAEERWSDALPYLERAAVLAPNSGMPWEHRAVCLWELGRADEARAALDRAEALGARHVGQLRQHMR